MKTRRYSIKSKDSKRFFIEISKRFHYDFELLFSFKSRVEIFDIGSGQLYLIEGKPLFFKISKLVMPTLLFDQFHSTLPTIVVDMGAVPFVCKGANIMVPGIVRVENEFEKDELVLIIDEKHSKPLAIGNSLYSSNEIRKMKQGIVIKNLHFVSDKIWIAAKALISK